MLRNCGFEMWLLRICQNFKAQCQSSLERSHVVTEALDLHQRLGSMFQAMNTIVNIVLDHLTDPFLVALSVSHLLTQTRK